jgi:hypothetical protein
VSLEWSTWAPGGVAETMNELQKGDCYPDDPGRYWCTVSSDPAVFSYADSSVARDTQYQYRVKYRADLPSVNTYNVYTSAQMCGGPIPTPGPLEVSPNYQTTPPNVTVLLTATGGTGSFIWETASGSISGFGGQVGVTFTNDSTDAVERTVTVRSGTQSAVARVLVEGVETFSDDIEFTGQGTRWVRINDDAPTTEDAVVSVRFSHGFEGIATSSVTMRLGRSVDEALAATPQPFSATLPWNLCTNPLSCPAGLYAVYAVFSAPGQGDTPVVFDTIGYLAPTEFAIEAAVAINNGDAATDNRRVQLELRHRFTGLPDAEVAMQLANTPEELDGAAPIPFTGFVEGWDLCGSALECANGIRTVYARFCAYGTCSPVVSDDIDLHSLWPSWGVTINDDALQAADPLVTLTLNPWFASTGTLVLISNNADMSDAALVPFSMTVPWDLCRFSVPCTDGDRTVYVQYQNASAGWPASSSPQFDDAIALSLGTLPPPVVPQLTAGVLINDGAASVDSRYVRLSFESPFGAGSDVSMRPINDAALNARDRSIIQDREGGVDSQRDPRRSDAQQPSTLRSVSDNPTGDTPDSRTAALSMAPELESGTVRPFVERIENWDLCQGASSCPYGTYKVFVQYYRAAGVGGLPTQVAVLSIALAGDDVSEPYYDTIEYQPPVTGVPPVEPPAISPPAGSGAGGSGGGVGGMLEIIATTLGGAENVIVPISLASSAVVTASAVMAIIPLFTGSVGVAAMGAALWDWLMSLFGLLPRRKKVWGTVYDSSTKRPIPFVKVQLLGRNKRVLETRTADKDGRYGFLTTPMSMLIEEVEISIVPIMKDYSFPSRVTPTVETFVYSNIYRGEPIKVSNEMLINFDVPMDPLHPSRKPLVLTSPSIALGASVAAVSDAGFWLGLVMVPLNFLLAPNPFTLGVLCLFLGAASLRIWGIGEHPFGTVIDSATGRPMPFALITLNDLTGKRVAFAVTDELGRYFLVAPRGIHELVVHAPGATQPPRQSKQVLDVRRGWITKRVVV